MEGRLLRMVRERAAEQAPASGQQGGINEGGVEHEAPGAVGIDGGVVAPTIDTGMIGASYGEVHMATFDAHVLKGLPPEYGFLRRKLEISSPYVTVERVCSKVLMEEQTLSIEQSYKQITSDASAFSGAVNTIVAVTGVNGKEGKGGREQTDKKKDGKREKKRAPFKGRCYNCNEEGHMAAKCPNKKKDTTPAAAANVAKGDEKGVALTVACSAAKLLADDKDLWFLDSGCSQHMTGRKEWFTVIRDPSATKSVKGFDGSMQKVAGVGEVLLEGTNGLCVTLNDVLFVPGMKANLVSPGQLLDKGAKLQTEEGVTRIIASGGQVAATARYGHRLHCLDLKPGPARNGATTTAACNGTVTAAACTDMADGAASNGTGAASACNGTTAATTRGRRLLMWRQASRKLKMERPASRRTRWAPRQRPTYGTLALDTSDSMR
ncbi:unnamed protein product [Closterium sp. NIES-65]|nr:unnamed protein product [Closterium sp. NIES-65]